MEIEIDREDLDAEYKFAALMATHQYQQIVPYLEESDPNWIEDRRLEILNNRLSKYVDPLYSQEPGWEEAFIAEVYNNNIARPYYRELDIIEYLNGETFYLLRFFPRYLRYYLYLRTILDYNPSYIRRHMYVNKFRVVKYESMIKHEIDARQKRYLRIGYPTVYKNKVKNRSSIRYGKNRVIPQCLQKCALMMHFRFLEYHECETGE